MIATLLPQLRRCFTAWMTRPWKLSTRPYSHFKIIVRRQTFMPGEFTTAADRQHVDAFIRRGIRARICDENTSPAMCVCVILSRTMTMRFSSGLWETNIVFSIIFFLTAMVNLSTTWHSVVINLFWLEKSDTWQIALHCPDYTSQIDADDVYIA